MKLERIGDWVRNPYAIKTIVWIRPDEIRIGNKYPAESTPWEVSIILNGVSRIEKYFSTESEAVEFAREIMGGKRDE